MLDFSRQHGGWPGLIPDSLTLALYRLISSGTRSLTLLIPRTTPARSSFDWLRTNGAAFACAVVYDRGSQRKRERERPERNPR